MLSAGLWPRYASLTRQYLCAEHAACQLLNNLNSLNRISLVTVITPFFFFNPSFSEIKLSLHSNEFQVTSIELWTWLYLILRTKFYSSRLFFAIYAMYSTFCYYRENKYEKRKLRRRNHHFKINRPRGMNFGWQALFRKHVTTWRRAQMSLLQWHPCNANPLVPVTRRTRNC